MTEQINNSPQNNPFMQGMTNQGGIQQPNETAVRTQLALTDSMLPNSSLLNTKNLDVGRQWTMSPQLVKPEEKEKGRIEEEHSMSEVFGIDEDDIDAIVRELLALAANRAIRDGILWLLERGSVEGFAEGEEYPEGLPYEKASSPLGKKLWEYGRQLQVLAVGIIWSRRIYQNVEIDGLPAPKEIQGLEDVRKALTGLEASLREDSPQQPLVAFTLGAVNMLPVAAKVFPELPDKPSRLAKVGVAGGALAVVSACLDKKTEYLSDVIVEAIIKKLLPALESLLGEAVPELEKEHRTPAAIGLVTALSAMDLAMLLMFWRDEGGELRVPESKAKTREEISNDLSAVLKKEGPTATRQVAAFGNVVFSAIEQAGSNVALDSAERQILGATLEGLILATGQDLGITLEVPELTREFFGTHAAALAPTVTAPPPEAQERSPRQECWQRLKVELQQEAAKSFEGELNAIRQTLLKGFGMDTDDIQRLTDTTLAIAMPLLAGCQKLNKDSGTKMEHLIIPTQV